MLRALPVALLLAACESASQARPAHSGPDSARVARAIAGLRPGIEVEGRPPVRWTMAERLALDTDVNRYLRSWHLPASRFTEREPVTLRRITGHNAGLAVHGFRGYAEGESVPTVPQLLDGAPPANSGPVRADTTPGAIVRYSGGGTTVQQLVLTDATGESFPALMKRLVLDPARMSASTYEQPLPRARWGDAARSHRADGTMVRGRWHTYPEMAAAGLWTTPTDLAKWAIALAASRSGTDTTLLPQRAATEMLTEQGGGYGIGPALASSGRAFRFGHNGANEGFRATLSYLSEAGVGVAIMVNSDRGSELASEIANAVMAEFEWPGHTLRRIPEVAADPSGTFHNLPYGWRLVFAGDSVLVTPNPAVTFTARRARPRAP